MTTPRFGQLGQQGLRLDAAPSPETPPPSPEDAGATGWKLALSALNAEILPGERQPLPPAIEKLAPALNVLETAGEVAAIRLPSGRRYSLWGWPDLQRPGAKVIAVGEGEPLAEVIALHRYPVLTGICMEAADGVLPATGAPIQELAVALTGRPLRQEVGQLFALSGDAIYLLRGTQVFRWDGRKETQEGTAKQVLATLLLHWSNR